MHGYWSIDLELRHTTARDDLPVLVVQLRSLDLGEDDDAPF